MPGVKKVEWGVFFKCPALEDVECGKLEIIEEFAFGCCESLRSVNLLSARIVGVCILGVLRPDRREIW